MLIKTENINF